MKLEYLKNKLNLLVVTWLQLIDDVNNKSLKHLQTFDQTAATN